MNIMNYNVSGNEKENIILKPVITVFGVGGAGGNAVNNMIISELQGVTFVVANTDAQALEYSLAEHRVQLGANVTRGLGAGASPDAGLKAAEESSDEIKRYLRGSNMVFITAGMGGGTGTGASPFIARIAREMGILTIGVVTKPFHFEGMHRMKVADKGIEELQKYVDTLIIIPNQNLFRIANERTTFADAFKMADDVLHSGVRCITDLIIMPGLINLDFADICTIMKDMSKAMMGAGEASGEDRAIRAANAAISNPLLDNTSIRGAKGVLINITGGMDMTLFEVDAAANRIREEISNADANIIFGSTFNKDMDFIRVSVVATGIDSENKKPVNISSNTIEGKTTFGNQIKASVQDVHGQLSLDNAHAGNVHGTNHETQVEKSGQYNISSKVEPFISNKTLFTSYIDGSNHEQDDPKRNVRNINVLPNKDLLDSDDIYDVPAFLRRKHNN